MSMTFDKFDKDVLAIDAEEVATAVAASTRRMTNDLKRRGLVVGVSGGVDSAVCAALAVRAVGPDRVTALLMPEADSDPESTERGRLLCKTLGVDHVLEDIAPSLAALGCYRRRDEAIRRVFPAFGEGWRQKIALAEGLLDRDRVSYFTLVVESPDGERSSQRMPTDVYLEVVAATNMKQRTRKLMEYFHAEARNYAVLGTPNRLEYELGFFVRGGDGLADLKPIAHLYKTQVYALARHLSVPDEISSQPPSTDTYSLPQSQEEFYFALPYAEMDLMLWAWHHGVPASAAGEVMDLTAEQVERVYRDIVAKRRAAERGLRDSMLVEKVDLRAGPAGSGGPAGPAGSA
jgi:NAD+ synthase